LEVSVAISPIRDSLGQMVGISKIIRDVTSKKATETKIHELNKELERRLWDQTVELTTVNKELEVFAYSVSHDLRAPIRHIDGFIDLLKKQAKNELSEQSLHYFKLVVDSVSKMGMLVDDLLTFSRVSRAKAIKSKVDSNALVRFAINELKNNIAERSIE